MNNQNRCRLCNGPASIQFSRKILSKYDVDYFRCGKCQSLQTETPYWLDEAYGKENLSHLDTGSAQRNVNNLAACFLTSKIFNAKNVPDVGGGDGLLCRMLRDHSINCFVKDRYAKPTYAQGFTEPDFETPDLLIGFEVLEHFPNPQVDLVSLFERSPKALLLSTAIYSTQESNWWYLTPESGQHVFFYSKTALNLIAESYGYTITLIGEYILLTKSASKLRILLAKTLLSPQVRRIAKAYIAFLPTPGVWNDYLHQIKVTRAS